ncbi:MAG: zinc-binding dehydrogenase [Thermaerobacter sp.]|nr:zinc-binding dehydrogenase [Thermaerobacter sp.]
MKAVRMHGLGGTEVLHYEDAPEPLPRAGEVLLRVRSASLNHLDIWTRAGLPGRQPPRMPHILGNDAAGEIAALGEGVDHLRIGDRVVVNPGYGCGHCEHCLSGRETLCREYRILGYELPGTYAQYVTLPAQNVVPMPPSLDFEGAGSIGLVFLTAWHMLVTLAKVRPGETVLVLGAGSGVGIAAIQIAKLFGAHVIATASGEEKCEKAVRLGADETIDHAQQEIYREVRRLTQKKGVEVVVEHVGQVTWPDSLRSLQPGGRLVTCGATTGPFGETDIRYIFSRQLQVLGSYMGSRGELLQLMPLFADGRLRPVVDRTFPLSEAAAAQEHIEARRHFGKVVLLPD